ncbi:MAG: hypothetical protein E7158_06400 [Firmicutes bacterium]|nr:hypothetical protein [Bacillota bacterium]
MKRFLIFLFIIIFIVVFLITYIMDLIKIKKKKTKKIGEVQYLINKFNLSPTKLKYKKVCLVISLLNAFIIATVTSIISLLDVPMALQFLVGFILLFALIYSLYEIYGRILVKKGYEKNKQTKKKGSKK